MEFRDRIRVIKKYGLLLFVGLMLGAGLGWGATMLQPPTYAASTRVFVSVQTGQTTAELAQGSSFTESRVSSYASLADSQRVLDAVITTLGLDVEYWDLAERVTVSIVEDTTVLELTATSDDPTEAAALADATARSLADAVREIESRPDFVSPVQLAVIQEARVPDTPASPRPLVNVGLGALAGLVLAALWAVLRELLDTSIHTERDVRTVTDVPILGSIAFDPKAKQRPLILHTDPLSPRSESYRALRTSLKFVEVDERSRTFVVTSPMAAMGKSTTAANLALALADAGAQAILVDADLRKPKIANIMNIEGSVGLSDVLADDAELDDAVQRWGDSTLRVLPAGRVPPNPSELLGSRAMVALIERLQAEYEWVLFDSPPLLPVTDAAVLSEHVDAVIMAVAVGRTSKHQLALAVERLENVETTIGGIVLTMVPTKGVDGYGYGYGDYEATASRAVRPTEPASAGKERAAPVAARTRAAEAQGPDKLGDDPRRAAKQRGGRRRAGARGTDGRHSDEHSADEHHADEHRADEHPADEHRATSHVAGADAAEQTSSAAGR